MVRDKAENLFCLRLKANWPNSHFLKQYGNQNSEHHSKFALMTVQPSSLLENQSMWCKTLCFSEGPAEPLSLSAPIALFSDATSIIKMCLHYQKLVAALWGCPVKWTNHWNALASPLHEEPSIRTVTDWPLDFQSRKEYTESEKGYCKAGEGTWATKTRRLGAYPLCQKACTFIA